MKKITASLLVRWLLLVGACVATPAFADCQERIQGVKNDIDRNKDKYTREARVNAQKHLVQAALPSLSLFQCTEHILKAKKALKAGKK